jgi:hypothetical protein
MADRRQSSVMGNVKTAQNRHLQPPGTGLSQRYRDHAKLEKVVNARRDAGLPD